MDETQEDFDHDRGLFISLQTRFDALDEDARSGPKGAELQRQLHDLLKRIRPLAVAEA